MKPLKLLIIILLTFVPTLGSALATNDITISSKTNNDSKEIQLNSEENFQISSFVRHDKLFIIIDRRGQIQIVGNKHNQTLENFKITSLDNKQLLTLDFPGSDDFETTAFKTNKGWLIKITPYDNSILSSEIAGKREITKNITASKAELEIETSSSNQNIITFEDPYTGETIITIPENKVIRNNITSFIDFQIIPSMVGLTILPLNDHLEVIKSKNTTIISSSSYLNLSQANFDYDNLNNLFNDPTSLLAAPILTSYEINNNINKARQIIINSPDQITKGFNYFKFVQLYFELGFYKEAQALLEFVNRNTDLISRYYQVRLVVAALYLLDDKVDEAYDLMDNIDLNQVNLDNKQEFRFWQNLTKVIFLSQKEDQNLPLKMTHNLDILVTILMDGGENFLKNYHPDLVLKIKFKLLDLAINHSNINLGKLLIKLTNSQLLKPQDKKRLQYYQGVILQLDNQDKAALKMFDACLADNLDNYFYSHCGFHKLELLKEDKQIDYKDYINQLQTFSILWRGDKFEITLLNKLVTAYIESNDLSNAMRVLKIIAENYPDNAVGFKATTKARKIFIEYFQSYTGDNRLHQLAFFYEFQDFIPVGDIGDKIILQVAQSMLDLNLLDQAIKLMDFQVKNRLVGLNKDKIINKLIKTYQINGDDKEGIKLTEAFTSFPMKKQNPLLEERYKLYLQSLINNRQYEDALALLYHEESLEGDQLRALVFGQMGDWESFTENSEPYLYSIRYDPKYQLTNLDKERILRQNIAYFYTGQTELLEKFFADFKRKMHKGDKWSEINKLFFLITRELSHNNLVSKKAQNNVKSLIKKLVDLP
jgi:hypothetical protein